MQRTVRKQIAEPVELALSKPTPEMWDKILREYTQTLNRAEQNYLSKAKSMFH